jgi:serine/threonine protein kinase
MPATHTADCPPERLIVDFSRGKLNDAAAETVSAHLETCIDCRAAADRVVADSFIQRLRAAHGQISAAAPLSSQADSVSRANSATVTLKSSAPQVSPSKPAELSVPPELVDHPDYEVVKELGRGGMGVVYLARNRAMDRLEVLKVVSRAFLEKADARERFQREIRSAAKLSHPNIVTAHSVPRAGDLLIFAMEYVDGQDLSQVVKQRGPLPVINAVYYAHQAALGLEHAHEHGMVHRDIKPNNLILSVQAKRHVIKILDFGLAKATSEKVSSSELTGSGQILGTPDYMAPEQSLDAQKADIRADIYSLGCTLYYMLAGRPPFAGSSMYALLAAHHSDTARRLNDIRSEVPAELAAVAAKMMAKDPAYRYQTPAQVSQALGPFYRATGGEAAKLTPMTEETVSRDTPPEVFDPYYQWLGIAPEEQPVDHYRLLGAKRFEPNPEVIANLADQRAAHLRTFQGGQHSAVSQSLLNEVAAARVCLLKAERKAVYDAELRRSIAARPQALPPVAVPLAPPLAAVGAPAAAPLALPELSPARKAVAWVKRAMAWLKSRLGVHRFPPALLYTALGSFAALIVLCVVEIKLSTPDGELTVEIDKPNADHVLTIEQDGQKILTTKFKPSANTTPAQPPPKATEGEHQGNQPWESAAFQQWTKEVAALPAEQQVRAVVRKLRELNPGFDGKETHTIDRDVVTQLQFPTENVSDISPVRALQGLMSPDCHQYGPGKGAVSDLSPLEGMHLTKFDAGGTKVFNLSPLKEMRLTRLSCWQTAVSDLAPLKGMPLVELWCDTTPISDLSPLHGMPLKVLICGTTPISDLSPLEGMPLEILHCDSTSVSDLAPLKGMPIEELVCRRSNVLDLSPLHGLRLTRLDCCLSAVQDLSPLRGMPLVFLNCGSTAVSDLSPISGMQLTGLHCDTTRVADLRPVKGMPLSELYFFDSMVSDLTPLEGMELADIRLSPDRITHGINILRQMKSVERVGLHWDDSRVFLAEEFWRKYDAGDFLPWNKRPGFEKWVAETTSLAAEKQLERVAAKLQDLNPGFDGKLTGYGGQGMPRIQNGVVTELGFSRINVTDISPLRALVGVKRLNCSSNDEGPSALSDLSPLKGIRLTALRCAGTQVSDLSPLDGMQLRQLDCWGTRVSDLSPLKGMPLTELVCGAAQVSDLSPLKGLPLKSLRCGYTPVSDLSPLTGVV